ncbi:MAG TPA: hypothetical protein VN176_13370 [Verrucomicrobiae bacterium]|jgi:hypothetical protein|nr:hypothetical protein [Verrucomicrobiae bacterium]
MAKQDSRIEEYRRAQRSAFVGVLALSVRNQLGRDQAVTLELSPEDASESVVLTFFNVRQLRFADLHPGSTCYLSIEPMGSAQWEGVSYRVHNIEQDLTLSFYCADFEIKRMNAARI